MRGAAVLNVNPLHTHLPASTLPSLSYPFLPSFIHSFLPLYYPPFLLPLSYPLPFRHAATAVFFDPSRLNFRLSCLQLLPPFASRKRSTIVVVSSSVLYVNAALFCIKHREWLTHEWWNPVLKAFVMIENCYWNICTGWIFCTENIRTDWKFCVENICTDWIFWLKYSYVCLLLLYIMYMYYVYVHVCIYKYIYI